MLFPTWTPTLRLAMQQELELRVNDMVLTQHGDFLSLYDSKSVFVNNELARSTAFRPRQPMGFVASTYPTDRLVSGCSDRAPSWVRTRFLSALRPPRAANSWCRRFSADDSPPPPGVPPLAAHGRARFHVAAATLRAPREPAVRFVSWPDGSARLRHGELRHGRDVPHDRQRSVDRRERIGGGCLVQRLGRDELCAPQATGGRAVLGQQGLRECARSRGDRRGCSRSQCPREAVRRRRQPRGPAALERW